MTRTLAALATALLVLPTAAAILIGQPAPEDADGPLRSVEPSPAAQQGFRWDFSDWGQDADGDRLDDLIEAVAASGLDALPRHADGFLPYFARETPAGPLVDVYVAYDTGVGEADLAALDAVGLAPHLLDDLLPGLWLQGVTPEQAAEVSGLPGVVAVELAHQYRTLNAEARDTARVSGSTHARTVWDDLGLKGTDVGLAVLDTGGDDEHQHLNGRFVAGVDTVDQCGNQVERNPDDDQVLGLIGVLIFHGTHVAGTAVGDGGGSASSPGSFSGMAPDADYYDGKVLSAAGASCLGSVSAGLNWVVNFNAGSSLWKNTVWNSVPPAVSSLMGDVPVPASKKISVVSMSLGGGCSTGSDSNSQRVNFVSGTGVVSVIAVGNDGLTGCITTPSAASTAVSVGAVNDGGGGSRGGDFIAGFSNCGPSLSTLNGRKPDVVASGVNVVSAAGSHIPGLAGGSVKPLSGTSMATPVVSGAVALLLEANPDLSPAETKQILRETAEAKSSGGRGFQDSTFPKYHSCWGWGELDAYGAAKRAQDIESGSVSGPASASTGQTVSYTLSMDYTKSEFMEYGPSGTGADGDEVTLRLSFPPGWTTINIGSTNAGVGAGCGGVSGSPTASGVAGGTAEVTFTYTGDPDTGSDIQDCDTAPEVVVQAKAPSSPTTDELTAGFGINGIDGANQRLSVVVS